MRRPLTTLIVLVLAATAACARDAAPGTDAAGSTTSTSVLSPSEAPVEDGATTTSTAGGAPSTTAGGPGATTTSGARRPVPGPGSGSGEASDAPATTALTPAPAPAAGDDGSQGPPGAFARTLLRPQPATAIVLERYVQEGADVAATSLGRSARILGEVAGKPVDVRPPLALAGGARDWTAAELRATADRMARTPQGGGRAVLRLVLVRGTFEGSEDVLGVAVRGDVIALFRDNIAAASTPIVSGRSIEDAVLLHELGHVLGLVDLVLASGRADPEHPAHSRSRDSVMYWAVESGVVAQVLTGGPPQDFDAADLADLRTLRNGA